MAKKGVKMLIKLRNPETGTFYIESESYYGDVTRYFAKYDAENGVLAYAYYGNTTTLGNDAYFFF